MANSFVTPRQIQRNHAQARLFCRITENRCRVHTNSNGKHLAVLNRTYAMADTVTVVMAMQISIYIFFFVCS